MTLSECCRWLVLQVLMFVFEFAGRLAHAVRREEMPDVRRPQ